MGLVILCRGESENNRISWELTEEGNDIGALIEEAELLLSEAFHNNYKQ